MLLALEESLSLSLMSLSVSLSLSQSLSHSLSVSVSLSLCLCLSPSLSVSHTLAVSLLPCVTFLCFIPSQTGPPQLVAEMTIGSSRLSLISSADLAERGLFSKNPSTSPAAASDSATTGSHASS